MKAKHLCFIIAPAYVFLNHAVFQKSFLIENWHLYFIGVLFVAYSYKIFLMEKDETDDFSIPCRRFYFIYVYYFILYAFPRLGHYNVFNDNKGILGLNTTVTNCLVIFGIASIIYLLIISDFHINELSIGNTKVLMLREKYKKEADIHIDNTNVLLAKIVAENVIIANSRNYCKPIAEKFRETNELALYSEYQSLLEKYYEQQNDSTDVFVLYELNKDEIIKDYELKNKEYEQLVSTMKTGIEPYSFQNKEYYYMFLPFTYIFEIDSNYETYIVLQSKTKIITEEGNILTNILIKFTDDILEQISVILGV